MLSLGSFARLIPIILIPVFISCKGKTENTKKEEASAEVPAQDFVESAVESEVTVSQSHESKTDPAKEQALHEAALNGEAGTVDKLLEEGVNVNAVDAGERTALMYSSFNGHTEIVAKLLDSGAEVGLRDAMGRTALLFASTGPFSETVILLLENNADPNIRDADEHFTPIMHAAAEGQLEVVKILLKYGADRSLKDVDGEDAELFARNNGHIEVADLLKAR